MVKDYPSLDSHDSHYHADTTRLYAEVLEAGDAGAGFDANTTLSVVMRFHKQERLAFLDEALFSLAIQHWHDLETIVVIQNGTDEITAAVIDLIKRQPWPASPRYKVLSYAVPEGIDGRSSLLNYGVANASGRYLAFLDDDDVVYQYGYATLIERLVAGGRAVAMGGCRTAKNEFESGRWFVKIKESPFNFGQTRLDLFHRNFVPIHSYVIDRARTGAFNLWFDDELPPVEDYDFLLRLCAAFEPDFSKLATPVCEYRFHGANSTPYDVAGTGLTTISGSGMAKVLSSMAKIDEKKKHYICSLSVSELAELAARLAGLQSQLEQLQLERAGLAHSAARALTKSLGKRKWLVKPVSKLVRSSLKIIRR